MPTINEAPQKVAEEEMDDPEDDSTLFIKNINFDTTEDSIKEVHRYIFQLFHTIVFNEKFLKKHFVYIFSISKIVAK